MRQIGRDPIFIERGEGCELVDVDGNRYVDWVCSWGPLILGHADPAVVAAVPRRPRRGDELRRRRPRPRSSWPRRSPRAFRSVEMVRMTSSGTEAAMSAVRLARAATGREVVVKFAGAYHGHSDGLLAEAGSGLATLGDPGQPRRHRGAGRRHRGRPLERPRGGRAGARRARGRRACSPSRSPPTWASSRRPTASSSSSARRPASAGALLVFDEVITGFRVARGGAQELYGVEPDLTVLGKVLGGGLPAAAYGGPRELMERIAPAGDVYQAGTLSGNPLAVAAGLATLRAARRRAPTSGSASSPSASPPASRRWPRDRPLQVASVPGLLTLFFSAEPVADFAGASRLRPRGPRALLPGDARPRRLPAAVAVRGLVRLASPTTRTAIDRTLEAAAEAARGGARMSDRRLGQLRRARRPAARGGDADLPARGRRPSPARLPALGRVAAVRVARGGPRGLPPPLRRAALLAGHDADLALLAGDYLYALGIERLAALGDATPFASSPT